MEENSWRDWVALFEAFRIALVPSALLLCFQLFLINPFLESTIAQKQQFLNEHQYLTAITITWDGSIINSASKANALTDSIRYRLRDDQRIQSIQFAATQGDVWVTQITLVPRALPILNSTLPRQEISDILNKARIRGTEGSPQAAPIAIRTVFSNLVAVDEPHQTFSWNNTAIQLSLTSHISLNDIVQAQPRKPHSLLVTLTDRGQTRLQNMAQFTETSKSQVALVYHNQIVGIYSPIRAFTDQFVIDPITTDVPLEQAADELSMPRPGSPPCNIQFHSNSPEPEGIRFALAHTILGLPTWIPQYGWFILLIFMVLVSCLVLLDLFWEKQDNQSQQ